MVDSLATAIYGKKNKAGITPHQGVDAPVEGDQEMAVVGSAGHFHAHHHGVVFKEGSEATQLLRYRVVAMVILLLMFQFYLTFQA